MIGERIRSLRKEKRITITELADRAGVAKSYLSNIERGVMSNPSIQFVEKVSVTLGVTIDYLLHGPNHQQQDDPISHQWYELVLEAMDSGVSKEQFREFLEFNKWKTTNNDKQ